MYRFFWFNDDGGSRGDGIPFHTRKLFQETWTFLRLRDLLRNLPRDLFRDLFRGPRKGILNKQESTAIRG